MTQVPKNPPPWGPIRDVHFEPSHQFEGVGLHVQVGAEEAILKGWWYRPQWYGRLVPDTRRCRVHGEIMYTERQLSQAELDILYAHQMAGMATGVANAAPMTPVAPNPVQPS
jgi:hypothetical protein